MLSPLLFAGFEWWGVFVPFVFLRFPMVGSPLCFTDFQWRGMFSPLLSNDFAWPGEVFPLFL